MVPTKLQLVTAICSTTALSDLPRLPTLHKDQKLSSVHTLLEREREREQKRCSVLSRCPLLISVHVLCYLIPWPGPQVLRVTVTFLVCDRIDTQSSPAFFSPNDSQSASVNDIVSSATYCAAMARLICDDEVEGRSDPLYIPLRMEQLEMTVWLDDATVMPSVLGLSGGAAMETPSTSAWLHRNRVMCLSALLVRRILVTRRWSQNEKASS